MTTAVQFNSKNLAAHQQTTDTPGTASKKRPTPWKDRLRTCARPRWFTAAVVVVSICASITLYAARRAEYYVPTSYLADTSFLETTSKTPKFKQTTAVHTEQHVPASHQADTGFLATTSGTPKFTQTTRVHTERCLPFPLKIPTNSSLFHCNTRWENISAYSCTHRLQAKLACSKFSADIAYDWVNVSATPPIYDFGDQCLARVIAERCTTRGLIPRVMHYVGFQMKDIPLHGLLSVISAFRFAEPCLILFHVDKLLTGQYWKVLLRLVPNVIIVLREAPTSIFGKKIGLVEHKSDVARLQAVKQFGGIYADFDHAILRPLEGLLNNTVVMGTELKGHNFGNGFMMGKANATFFLTWYDSYRTFKDNEWAVHSTIMPYKIYKNFTDHKVLVVDSFFRPAYNTIKGQFYEKHYNWTDLYGVHFYYRSNKKFFAGGPLETRNVTLGEVARHILYGRCNACLRHSAPDVTPVRWADRLL